MDVGVAYTGDAVTLALVGRELRRVDDDAAFAGDVQQRPSRWMIGDGPGKRIEQVAALERLRLNLLVFRNPQIAGTSGPRGRVVLALERDIDPRQKRDGAIAAVVDEALFRMLTPNLALAEIKHTAELRANEYDHVGEVDILNQSVHLKFITRLILMEAPQFTQRESVTRAIVRGEACNGDFHCVAGRHWHAPLL
ncbi:MAG: hypothetical protein R3D67_20255 [Hyphomicrobiaceae bacterium]